MRKGVAVILGLGFVLIVAVALNRPSASQSRPDLEARLRDFGMPAGAELVAAQQGSDGEFLTVYYRDSDGQVHMLGNDPPKPTPPSGG
jgi:hypothetical protein